MRVQPEQLDPVQEILRRILWLMQRDYSLMLPALNQDQLPVIEAATQDMYFRFQLLSSRTSAVVLNFLHLSERKLYGESEGKQKYIYL